MGAKLLSWGKDAFDALLSARIRQVAHVPDAGLSELINACESEPSMTVVSPLSEQDAVGLACGSWLGGDRAAVFMQSSGVGNCVNAFSMAQSCRMPLLLIVTMRGEWGEANPWQLPMGKATPDLLRLMGFTVHRLQASQDAVTTVSSATTLAFESQQMVAILISQAVIGSKVFTSGAAH